MSEFGKWWNEIGGSPSGYEGHALEAARSAWDAALTAAAKLCDTISIERYNQHHVEQRKTGESDGIKWAMHESADECAAAILALRSEGGG